MSKTLGSTRTPTAETEGRDALLAEVAFEAVWDRDLASDRLAWRWNLESVFGYRQDQVDGHVDWWRERVHPDDLQRVEKTAADAMGGLVNRWQIEYRFRRADGSWAWVASRCAIERDGGGRARRIVGAMIDVSQLKETASRLRLFTEQIPARATAIDRDLRVIWDTGAAFSTTDSVVGRTVPELFAQSRNRERVLDACQRALAGESSVLDVDDGTSAARLHLGPFRDPAGDVTGVIGLAFDITDHARSEAKVRESQRLLRQVLDTLPIGVAVIDRAGDVALSNPATARVWGGTIVRAVERWAKSKARWHATGREIAPDEFASRRALAEGKISLGELIDIETYGGDRKTIQHSAAPIRDACGVITGAVVVNEDVTERVRADDALRKAKAELGRRTKRLERLSHKLIEAQETERRAIARELHDDLGQVLTALKLNLLRRDPDDVENLALVDGAIARMRDLAQQMRPPLLDELGLAASLRWYVEREAERAGLAFQLSLEPLGERPPVTLEAAAFRIAQEALTNVIRHAAAQSVYVELGRVDGMLELLIRDDGRGFDVAEARRRAASGESQGLINIQERAELTGGDLEIESAPGKGTTMKVRLPLAAGARRGAVT